MTVVELWRYPVKSMAGERLDEAHVDRERGITGDRAFAVIDVETGTVASAKHPRKWAALLSHRATFRTPGHTEISLADGTTLDTRHADIDQALSVAVGREVKLSATPPPQATYEDYRATEDRATIEPLAVGSGTGTFFDFAPIHLVTTATLQRLRDLLPDSRIDRARFRPNLVIDTGDAPGFVENAWNGKLVTVGEVQLCVAFTCPRCVMTTLAQGDLPADPAVLRAAAEHNKQWFPLLGKKLPTVGMYATVVRGGTVRMGDEVRVEGAAPLRRVGAYAHVIKRAIRRR